MLISDTFICVIITVVFVNFCSSYAVVIFCQRAERQARRAERKRQALAAEEAARLRAQQQAAAEQFKNYQERDFIDAHYNKDKASKFGKNSGI